MPTTYTSLLGFALPVTGELSGTWGDTVNDYITKYVDAAVAGAQTISGSQTAVTLSTTTGSTLSQAGAGATGSAQYQIINCTGSPASLLTITAPATSKSYIVINATSTSQSVKVVGAGPTTGVTLVSGEKAVIAWNGSDFIKIASTVASAGGSNTQVQYNSSGVLAGSSNLTFDGTNLTAGGTASATKFIPTGGAATGNGMYLPTTNTLAWSNNGSETMRLDASGNLGLGVTPSAWASSWKAVQVGSISSLSQGASAQAVLGNNFYSDGTNVRYIATGAASFHQQFSGAHTWWNAASGSAGAVASFTQAMTLTAVSNLQLGGTADRGTTVGTNAIQIFNGTAPAGTLTNGVSLYSSSGDLNFMNSAGNGFRVGYRNLPAVGTQTGSYTLAAADVGKYVQIGSGGSITIPTSVFAEGDAITLYNNTTGNITITCSAPTAYLGGTNTVRTSITLATRGVANVLFYSATACVVTGNVS